MKMDENILFQNMEILREKFNISYREAKEVLDLNNNELISSLIFLEEKYASSNDKCSIKEYLENIKARIVGVYKEGYNQRVIISRNENIIADVPLTAVVISSFAFLVYPTLLLMKLGGIALLNIKFKVINKSGEVYDISSDVKEKMSKIVCSSKEKISDIFTNVDIKNTANYIKNKATEFGKKTIENFNDLIEKKIIKSVDNNVAYTTKFVYENEEDNQ